MVDVSAVYEALAHLRAPRTPTCCCTSQTRSQASEPAVEEVALVARSHGIGVIVAGKPDDYSTWDEQEEAQPREPDPERLDQFIGGQLSKEAAQRIARALR